MFFDGSFFLKNSVNSLISICFSDLKDQKLPVSAIKTQIDNNRPKNFTCPAGLTNGQGSLPAAITAQIWQSGRLLMSKPDSCEIISKSDLWFLRTRFFCTIQT